MIIWFTIGLVAGTFIGWNFPQPAFAKKGQAWIQGKLSRK